MLSSVGSPTWPRSRGALGLSGIVNSSSSAAGAEGSGSASGGDGTSNMSSSWTGAGGGASTSAVKVGAGSDKDCSVSAAVVMLTCSGGGGVAPAAGDTGGGASAAAGEKSFSSAAEEGGGGASAGADLSSSGRPLTADTLSSRTLGRGTNTSRTAAACTHLITGAGDTLENCLITFSPKYSLFGVFACKSISESMIVYI